MSLTLLIDTENYAGNFERELCAYVTGQVGECGVGKDIAEKSSKEIKHIEWWNKNIRYEYEGDYGEPEPCDIYPNPDWVNNGNGKHYKIGSNEEKKLKAKYPAYLSVCIYIINEPTKDVLDEFKERAEIYCKENDIILTGFRKLEEKKKLSKLFK